MLFVGTSIIHPSTEGVFLLCNILDLLIYSYMNKSYCLIQYYYSNVLIGMERMNYVIEYIVNHRNDDTTQNE